MRDVACAGVASAGVACARVAFVLSRRAHSACGNWGHRSPPVSAWPATPEVAGALAGGTKIANEVPAAVCTYVTFSLLLRIG